jgi:hypothetical protein
MEKQKMKKTVALFLSVGKKFCKKSQIRLKKGWSPMSSKKDLTRREFLTRGTQAAAGVIAGGTLLPSFPAPAIGRNIIGANDRINLAIIGIRSRGMAHVDNFAKIDNVHIKALVDADENLFASRIAEIEKAHGYKPAMAHDMRHVFEDKEIDAVGVATPNHWHSLATIWACRRQARLCREPCSHNIWEGCKMVKRRANINVSCKSARIAGKKRDYGNALPSRRQARENLHGARVCLNRATTSTLSDGPLAVGETFALTIGSKNSEPAYTTEYLNNVHYDLWLGPAPSRPFNRNRFHYNWHWHWDYGNGDTGNQGPHQFDIARWGLNKNEYPVKVRSFGGNFIYDSSQETPNTHTTISEYADGTILNRHARFAHQCRR